MNRDYDLNKLLAFAREQGVALKINYWEASDELELEVVSAAKAECFYQKRAIDADHFIESWKQHVANQASKGES